ncbi:Holliday junction resolvase RecU [Shouchella lonarensis]|uniref:Holliday junction resolvase RecU n=1 Tax=Shouchella lonarensis TaxID=1464122 RepID=A0A1G6HBJ5_9BACI|nr:Holliday junction resolvase RecU [Shouchella lonarensis]SDB91305.1 recombination protein U [Shouchella lonarensis]
MTIRYPNGQPYTSKSSLPSHHNPLKKSNYSGRGMTLEQDIDETNTYYLHQGVAVIHKKPTPIQVVHVDYPKRSAAVIREAYYKQASTTDYNGVFQGAYIDFEAKETRNKTSFPLKNVHEHQIEHMRQVLTQSGICFFLIRFQPADEVYLLEAHHVIKYYDEQQRKSIPKKDIEQYGHTVKTGLHPRIDFLKTVKQLYF